MSRTKVGPWYRWYAWRPVNTQDRGWRWLVRTWRRRVRMQMPSIPFAPESTTIFETYIERPAPESDERIQEAR